MLGLRWFPDGNSRATGYWHVDEVATVEGLSQVAPAATVIPSTWCQENTLGVHGEAINVRYSGNAHAHDGNVQTVIASDGLPLLIGRWRILERIAASPGSTGDIARATLVLTHFKHGYVE